MKKVKVLFLGVLILSASMLSTGCMSMAFGAISNAATESNFRKEIKKETPELNPTNSAIVIGIGGSYVKALQQNPEVGVKKHEAVGGYISTSLFTDKPCFVFKPLPVGSELKIVYSNYTSGDVIYYYDGGIAGVDLVCPKPGLYFYNFKDGDNSLEPKALEFALDFYEGTEWESLIKTRIEELKK